MIKPQISKEYATSLVLGKPDLSILENDFEKGDKFYEPQYSVTRLDHPSPDENGQAVDIRFRESES